MASAADVALLRSSNQRVVTLAERDLRALWQSLNLDRPEASRDALLDALPEIVARYGDIAATLAGDWYDDLRSASRARGRFSAVLADPTPAAAVESQVRFGAAHLFTPNPTAALDFLTIATSKYVLAPGRQTVAVSVERDPAAPKWARVPSGAKTCDFCLDLASRGAVYTSLASAGGEFHGHCDCTPTPIWDASDLPDGYDPDALLEEYEARQAG